jgi:hypothetical protein
MLIPKIIELIAEIEQLPLDKQETLAEVLKVEINDMTHPPVTLDVLRAELDEDIAQGDVYDLDMLDKLPWSRTSQKDLSNASTLYPSVCAMKLAQLIRCLNKIRNIQVLISKLSLGKMALHTTQSGLVSITARWAICAIGNSIGFGSARMENMINF